jgi:hypothetical protein
VRLLRAKNKNALAMTINNQREKRDMASGGLYVS